MQIIDLSHPIAATMPVYPGTAPPSIVPTAILDKDGFVEHQIKISTHIGTHVDAPAHMLPDTESLDRLPLDHFMGNAVTLNLSAIASQKIDVAELEPHHGRLKKADFVLLHTGWSKYWGQPSYFKRFPILDRDAARWLGGLDLTGLGVDTPSLDDANSIDYPIHKHFLSRNVVLIENLTNLDQLPQTPFTVACFPLPIHQADGCPVRAVAIIE
jgi:kynurenine formamidase